MAATMKWSWAFLLTSWITNSLGCNPEFCEGKTHGSTHCDPADSSSYYICDNGVPKHFTCNTGLIYDGTGCNYATATPCVTVPVPDPEPGIVVNGVCVGSGSPDTNNEESPGSAGTANNTGNSGNDVTCTGTRTQRNVYRRHPQKECACPAHETLDVLSRRECATSCLRSSVCTDFNFLTLSPSDNCELLGCTTDPSLSVNMESDCYEEI